jgi:ELWxxDGT repeat protein
VLLFRSNDGTHGSELWKSDGTFAGTVLVKDIRPDFLGSNPEQLTVLNDTLFFKAAGTLWRSDGSEPGTVEVTDMQPAHLGTGSGFLFFAASDGTTGTELWRSDGTGSGTVLVKDIVPGDFSSSPGFLTDVDGTLLFAANDGVVGTELWSSDGTGAGTNLVMDIRPGSFSSATAELTNLDGTLLFTANEGTNGIELWRSDGTPAGTERFTERLSGNCSFSSPQFSTCPSGFTAVGDLLFLQASDGTTGPELWKTDGTDTGTLLVKDIRPGDLFGNPLGGAPREVTPVNGTVFLTADDGTRGRELWKSDGTEAGTELVKDIGPGGFSGSATELTRVGGTLFFVASDGIHGKELWRSDGSEAGTNMVKDIRSGPSGSTPFSLTSNLTAVGGLLFFRATDDTGDTELWKSDGTEAGTVLVKDIHPTGRSFPEDLTEVNGTLFFTAGDGTNGNELWRSDGTSAGTAIVADLCPGHCGSFPRFLTNVGGNLVFWASDASHGIELWQSDGTPQGTVLVHDIAPGPTSSRPQKFTVSGDHLLFVANGHVAGEGPDFELWAMALNQPPVAMAGAYGEIECTSPAGAMVSLNGSNSSDADSSPGTNDDIVRFEWFADLGGPSETLLGTGEVLNVALPPGASTIALRVTDSSGETSVDETVVTVVDTVPPDVVVGLIPGTLWPPNHKMVDIQAVVTSTDLCSTPSVVLTAVSSDEADNGDDDGNTVDDIRDDDLGAPDDHFRLRAERQGGGDGRIYTVVYTATDGSGNMASAIGLVTVPHDQDGVVDPIRLAVDENSYGSVLSWGDVSGAPTYDVIRGDLSSLSETSAIINLGTVTCVMDNAIDPTTAGREDAAIPAVGEGFFYLVAYNDGTSSGYGTESAEKPRTPGAGDCD